MIYAGLAVPVAIGYWVFSQCDENLWRWCYDLHCSSGKNGGLSYAPENRYDYQPTRSGCPSTPLDSLTSHPEWFRTLTNGHFQSTKGNFAVVPFIKVVGPQPVPATLQEQ